MKKTFFTVTHVGKVSFGSSGCHGKSSVGLQKTDNKKLNNSPTKKMFATNSSVDSPNVSRGQKIQSTKWLYVLKIWGNSPVGPPGYAYGCCLIIQPFRLTRARSDRFLDERCIFQWFPKRIVQSTLFVCKTATREWTRTKNEYRSLEANNYSRKRFLWDVGLFTSFEPKTIYYSYQVPRLSDKIYRSLRRYVNWCTTKQTEPHGLIESGTRVKFWTDQCIFGSNASQPL